MEQNDTSKTELKPLTVLERFRQLSRQKDEQPEEKDVKAGGDVGAIYLTPDKKSTPSSEQEIEPLSKEMALGNRGRGFRGRGGRAMKRNYDHNTKPTTSRVKMMHQGLLECDVGITEYVNPGAGFKGIIKQRFTDFQVNEIDLAGNVVRLTNTDIPVEEDAEGPVLEDEQLTILTKEQWDLITEMYEKKEGNTVKVEVTDVDKKIRSRIHKAIKMKYGAEIYCNTVDIEGKKIMEIGLGKPVDKRKVWPRSRGEYLHFVVHKENTDTTEAIHILTHHLRMKANRFSYAGTKDKRAVTSQIMCVRKIEAEKLKKLSLWNIYVGNFEYKWNSVRLGDLKGNRFRIALRAVDADNDTVEKGVTSLKEKGFLNYFGNQRFGNSVVAPTHVIGKAIVQDDFKQAVELILKPRPNESSYLDLSAARDTWWKTRDAKKALKCLIYKDKTIEGKLLQGLDRHGPNAYVNALENLPKNTVLLYAHAYQSLLWNKIISRRVKNFGFVVLAGDLVLDNEDSDIVDSDLVEEEEENDEDSKVPTDHSKDEPVRKKLNVRVLSEEEAKTTSIFDVVYPLPGFDVIYPKNEIAQWYIDLMAEDGHTSESFKRNNRWFSLFGSYRKILNLPTDLVWKTLHYNDQNMDIIITDRGNLEGVQSPTDIPDGKYKALIIEFNLNPSSYATMALRELLKCETASCHHAALTAKNLVTSGSVDANEESTCKKLKLEENQTLDVEMHENIISKESIVVNGNNSIEPTNKIQKVDEANSVDENKR